MLNSRALSWVEGQHAIDKRFELSRIEACRFVARVQSPKAVVLSEEEVVEAVALLGLAEGRVLTDEDEWREWRQVGDPVVHIELRRWADVFIIAPLSANTLAKVANGMCDNLLTCIVRAWDFRKPLIVAPAMNTYMWESPFTEQHLDACRKLGIVIIPPVAKKLACGDVGQGGMASPDAIAQVARDVCESAGFPIEAPLDIEPLPIE